MESLGTLLPLVIIVLAFWLLIIRPARMRTRKQAELINQLMPGQEVMTTSGLYATVAAVEDDVLVLEASPGVPTRWAKAAVARIVPAPELSDTTDTTSTAGDE